MIVEVIGGPDDGRELDVPVLRERLLLCPPGVFSYAVERPEEAEPKLIEPLVYHCRRIVGRGVCYVWKRLL